MNQVEWTHNVRCMKKGCFRKVFIYPLDVVDVVDVVRVDIVILIKLTGNREKIPLFWKQQRG